MIRAAAAEKAVGERNRLAGTSALADRAGNDDEAETLRQVSASVHSG